MMNSYGLTPRSKPSMFLTVPANGRKVEDAAYDHLMNMRESELEDMRMREQQLRSR